MITLRFILVSTIAGILAAQSPQINRYSFSTGDVTLNSAGYTATLQQPATNAKTVTLETVTVYCSVSCVVTQVQNGTGATATAGTVTPLNPTIAPATSTFWTASNVGGGTAVGTAYHITGAGSVTFCYNNSSCPGIINSVTLGNRGINNNYSWVISSITGTVNIGGIEDEQ